MDNVRRVGSIPNDRIPLAIDWLHALFDSAIGVGQHSLTPAGGSMTLADGTSVTINLENSELRIEADHARSGDLERIAREALERTLRGDLGPGAWWSAHFSGSYGISVPPDIHFLRVMSEERPYNGHFRLADKIYLSFDPGDHKADLPRGLQMGTLKCHTIFWTPGPIHGEFSRAIAQRLGSLTKALCSFASGCALHDSATLWPAKGESLAEALRELPGLPDIAVESLALFPAVTALTAGGSTDAIERFQSALFS